MWAKSAVSVAEAGRDQILCLQLQQLCFGPEVEGTICSSLKSFGPISVQLPRFVVWIEVEVKTLHSDDAGSFRQDLTVPVHDDAATGSKPSSWGLLSIVSLARLLRLRAFWHRNSRSAILISEGECRMAVNEELITKILLLLPTHPTSEALLDSHDLTNVRAADIYAAVRILQQRKLVRMSELFGRDSPE
jgi:hypothetical protein